MLSRKAASRAAILPLILLFPVAITFIPIETSIAAVTLESQLRAVQTFATVDFITGDDPQTSDLFQSTEAGVFDQEANCLAGTPGDQATSAAHQLSYVTPELLLAEGSIQAQAEIGDLALFAEAFGQSRFTSIFSVDEETEVALLATLIASGNGLGNLILRHVDGEILVYRLLEDGEDSVDERHTLPPGAYELSVQVSGFGQAFPGGGDPAFSSFSLSLDFPSAADVAAGEPRVDASIFPVVAPNPIRGGARILTPARGVAGPRSTILVVDLGGRVVRRFEEVGPSGILWDTRDDAGRPVPTGVYLIRDGAGASTRATVIR